ncbi:MAG TPA: gamma-glutamyltransferase family protein [Firmicutes bacterium]|nr:gamma-glutamyltransferase family protein [Candidatus Fermentithermobacillaceae bacterium]
MALSNPAPFHSRYHHASLAKHGMVAAAHPLAVIAGLDVLREGGTAMDACIAMSGVTSVVLPHLCGLGGDAFLIYYEASTGQAVALNASGPPGDRSTVDHLLKDERVTRGRSGTMPGEVHAGKTGKLPCILPQHGILSVAVPGLPYALEAASKRFGVLGLKRCLEPAIRIAEEGFVVFPSLEKAVYLEREKIASYPECSRIYLPGGNPPRAGEIFRQPDLAQTLREFIDGGAEWFYRGPFAAAFMRMNDELQGTFTGEEFQRYLGEQAGFYQPLAGTYRGYTVLETAPVSQGFLVIEMLNVLEGFDMPSLNPLSSTSLHLIAEAKKLAFSDRNAYAGDPTFSGFDVKRYISKERADELRSKIHPERASVSCEPGPATAGDTTSFVAVDSWGNACSFIQSIAFSFGSGLVVPGTGVILNNRAGRSFLLLDGHPNCIAPGKKPMHTLNCYVVLKDGRFFIAGGTPGGDGQPQWNVQMLHLMLDHGAGPQDAADFPRWISFPGTDVKDLWEAPELRLESRFPEEAFEGLTKRGHKIRRLSPWSSQGAAQIIMRDPDSGLLLGGSDKRANGLALGY